MLRKGFFLGLFATGAQTLLLRELVSTLNGSDLFIGTAMFGWLVWVALGAYWGGKSRGSIDSRKLFFVGGIFLPIMIIVTRYAPLMVTDSIGEIISFSSAALISIIITLPLGFISGWLFPVIVRESRQCNDPILKVYLIEGIGACVAGVGVTLLAGHFLTTFSTAGAISVIVIAGSFILFQRKWLWTVMPLAFVLAVIPKLTEPCDRWIDEVRYTGYDVISSFDTPYSHQAILQRDSSTVLLTDNTIEAVYPEVQTNENLILPALAYQQRAENIWFIGRAEFGAMQLASVISNATLVEIDPRSDLNERLKDIIPFDKRIMRFGTDPISQLSNYDSTNKPQIILFILDDLGSTKIARLLTQETIQKWRAILGKGGLLAIMTHYDTDRFLTSSVSDILGTIYQGLTTSFTHVHIWPGTNTLFFASGLNLFDIPNDTLFSRLSSFKYKPQFVHEIYLQDRLSEFKISKLLTALTVSREQHSIEKPTLVMKQSLDRAKQHAADKFITSLMFKHPSWLLVFPISILFLFLFVIKSRIRYQSAGLFFFIIAGLVSLVLELLIFYLYQSHLGSLYAELAALIGVFMVGLSVGTYQSINKNPEVVERFSCYILALSILILFCMNWLDWKYFGPMSYLLMFLSAIATGGLFSSATKRYYSSSSRNIGLGYSLELAGSACGALLTITVLLPIIGLTWILVSCLILLGMGLVVSLISPFKID